MPRHVNSFLSKSLDSQTVAGKFTIFLKVWNLSSTTELKVSPALSWQLFIILFIYFIFI